MSEGSAQPVDISLDNAQQAGVIGGPWIESDGPRLTAAWALLAGMGLIMAGNGLQAALLGVRATTEGFGVAVTGVVMAAYFFGFFFGAKVAEQFLRTAGHIRVFAGLASTASAVALGHAVWINPYYWTVLRLIFGLCISGIFVVVESWLNDMATNANRGRLLAVHMVVTMGGLMVGQLLLRGADPAGFGLFILSSVLISVAVVPVTLSATSTPPLLVPQPLSLRHLVGIIPTGIFTGIWVGMSHGVLMGLGALYAASQDLSPSRIALFMAAPSLGALLLQFPIGILSDRISRRVVMFAVALQATACALMLLTVETGSPASLGLMFLLGGATFPLYSLAVALTADWVEPSQLTSASASMVRISGIGAVVGPLVGGAVMAITEPAAFYVFLAATHFVIAAYIAMRIIFRDALPVSEQGNFVPWPARSSTVIANLLRRPRQP